MNEQLVLDAVQHESISTRRGILQRLFAFWFDAFVYNQIWEDPRVDVEALEIDASSRILTISSGGCNVLNYMLHGPEAITAVDLNRHHIFLLRLKAAAAHAFEDLETFFKFFGHGKIINSLKEYESAIFSNLDEDARAYWNSRPLIGGRRIDIFNNGGLYEHSRNGYFLRFFHFLSRLAGYEPSKVLNARTLEEQQRLFDLHIDPFLSSRLIRAIGRLPVTAFGLGIPPQQYDELRKDASGASIIDIYRERLRRLACDFPIADNYFAWQAFGRRYDVAERVAVPDYLKAENYPKLRSNLGTLRIAIGSVTNEIKSNPRDAFNRFVFLDAQDWMDASTLIELWDAIAEKGENGSRIIFRTAGKNSPAEELLPVELRKKFQYEAARSKRLFERDRASIYGGFHLYVLNK